MEEVTPNKSLQLVDLPRVNEIAAVLATNGFGHVLGVIGLTSALDSGVETKTAPYARRLRQALVELGPTFVKLGQVLSVRPDILPDDVLKEFETLQDRVPPMPFENVREVVEAELHQPLEDVFEAFDEVPLGSASIAQVHRAVLHGGHEVAVKLQRQGIERKIRSDIHILYTLANLLEGQFTLPGLHTPTDIVHEFDQAIMVELDFLQELKAAERLLRHTGGDDRAIKVPKVYPRWSTRRLLVMEMIRGKPLGTVLNELEGPKRRLLAHAIMEATYRQVFEYGFFHGDPHPGNLFVTEDGRLAYLDFGVVGTLTGNMQDTIISAFTSMVFRDADTLAMAVYRAGAVKDGRVDLRAFREELEKKMMSYYGASLDDLASRSTFVEVIQMCTRFKISLPAEFAVLARAIALVEGEIRALLPGVDIVEEVRPYAQRLMTRRFAPDRVAHDLAKVLMQAQGHFRDLPTQFNQMVMDLENGNVTVITVDPDASALRSEIRSAVLRLSLGFFATTITMGAFLFLAAWSPTFYGFSIFGPLSVFMLAFGLVMFGFLGFHVLFARWLDLGMWRRRFWGVLRFFSWRRG
ncbi:MAG: AarF/UbiB family protein [Myxococcota bacterium]